jgi:protein-tyrosine kinase
MTMGSDVLVKALGGKPAPVLVGSHEITTYTIPTVGAVLVDMGRISLDQAEQVLVVQRQQGQKFGETAKALGFITETDLQVALARQQGMFVLLPHDRAQLSAELRSLMDYEPISSAMLQAVTQLQVRWLGETPERRSIVVMSARPKDGRTMTTAMLGLLMAQQGLRVVLVDANIGSGIQEAELGRHFGFVDRADCTFDQLMHNPTHHDRLPAPLDSVDLKLVLPGPMQLPIGWSASAGFTRMLDVLQSRYDAVLLDSPPCAERPDAYSLATRASSAVSLIRSGKSKARDQAQIVQRLRDAGVEHIGSIIVNH